MTNHVRARTAGFLLLGVFGLLTMTKDVRAQGLIVTGYGDIEWSAQDTETDGFKHAFDNHHFNLILLGSIADDVIVGAEVEYEHAGDETALEYGYVGYTGIKNLRLIGGKFILPFNRYNKDLHPTWISRMPGRPLVYGNVFPATYNDVGVWASGAFPMASGSRVVWDGYVVNGLEGAPDETNFRDLRDNVDEGDRKSNNKAVGGRLGLELVQGLGLGVSGYTGEYAANDATGEGLGITFFGADADYHNKGLELRGEFVSASQELTTGSDNNNRKGFYAQAAYEVNQFEPVLRYSWVDFEEDNDPGDKSELGVGMNYYLGPAAAIRLAYFFNIERHDEFKTDNNKLIGQFVIVF